MINYRIPSKLRIVQGAGIDILKRACYNVVNII